MKNNCAQYDLLASIIYFTGILSVVLVTACIYILTRIDVSVIDYANIVIILVYGIVHVIAVAIFNIFFSRDCLN